MLFKLPSSRFDVFSKKLEYTTVARQFEVQGKNATKNEYNACKALDTLKIPYSFQYEIGLGRRIRGGQIIDIVAWTQPLATAIWVDEEYWHSGEAKLQDKYERANLNFKQYGLDPRPVVLARKESEGYEDALEYLKEVFHL